MSDMLQLVGVLSNGYLRLKELLTNRDDKLKLIGHCLGLWLGQRQ
jgi:hypothetical protein